MIFCFDETKQHISSYNFEYHRQGQLRRTCKLNFSQTRNHRYVDNLQDLVNSYNSTPHRSLNYIAPNEVNDEKKADLWAYMYLKPAKNKPIETPKKRTV